MAQKNIHINARKNIILITLIARQKKSDSHYHNKKFLLSFTAIQKRIHINVGRHLFLIAIMQRKKVLSLVVLI